jgi:hypothetical protein
MLKRWLMAAGMSTMVAALLGCNTTVTMSNESDSWVDVRYFVGNPPAEEGDTWSFVAQGRQQIEPGSTKKFDLSDNPNFDENGEYVVHALIEPTAATWEKATQYWIELLTPVPMTVVVTEGEEGLEFSTEKGVLVAIPADTVDSRQYEHTTVIATPDDDDDDEGEPDVK